MSYYTKPVNIKLGYFTLIFKIYSEQVPPPTHGNKTKRSEVNFLLVIPFCRDILVLRQLRFQKESTLSLQLYILLT